MKLNKTLIGKTKEGGVRHICRQSANYLKRIVFKVELIHQVTNKC